MFGQYGWLISVMGVSLVSPPAAATWSENRNVVHFQGDLFFTLPGAFSVNTITFDLGLTAGTIIELRWGQNLQRFTAKAAVIGGNDLPTGSNWASVMAILQANYYLANDFTLALNGNTITLTAKVKGIQYNFTSYTFASGTVTNSTFGIAPTKIQNHGVVLECQIKSGTTYETIYAERIPFVGGAFAQIDISKLLHAELTPDMPSSWRSFSPIRHQKSWKKYRLKFAEAGAEAGAPTITSDYIVMGGGTGHETGIDTTPFEWVIGTNSNEDKALRFGSTNRWLQVDEPQFLTWVAIRQPYASVQLRVRVEYADNTIQAVFPDYTEIGGVAMYERIMWDVSFFGLNIPAINTTKGVLSYYVSVWGNGAQVSREYRYILDYAPRTSKRYFLYLNSLGAWDSFCAYGEASGEVRFTSERIEVPLPTQYDSSQGTLADSNTTSQHGATVATGYQTAYQISMLEDFQLSRYKYLYENPTTIRPIVLTMDPLPTGTDGQNLYSHTFQYQHAYKNNKFDGKQ
ncbi:hypothetical protein [Runella sp. SP2]|uniref:hypothetical protein n=1 Tax=Runella sp. SP2 TaxID=2268026 RepID=UPI000F08EA9F|nr:hypothetical protein [Runella sp. SP2]AYQ31383.1 hypothetical protein DTQ70_03960 [Runella sp. SP2]